MIKTQPNVGFTLQYSLRWSNGIEIDLRKQTGIKFDLILPDDTSVRITGLGYDSFQNKVWVRVPAAHTTAEGVYRASLSVMTKDLQLISTGIHDIAEIDENATSGYQSITLRMDVTSVDTPVNMGQGYSPKIVNEEWYVFDDSQQSYVPTGVAIVSQASIDSAVNAEKALREAADTALGNAIAAEATRAEGKEQELEETLYGASTSVIEEGLKNATEGSSINLFKGEVTVTEGTLLISLSTQCVAYYRYKLNNEGSYTNVSASESASIQVNSPITYIEVSVSPSNVTATGPIAYSIINRVGSGTGIVDTVNSLSSAVTPIPQLVTDVQSISGTVQTIASVVNGSPASSVTQPFAFTVGGYIKGSGVLHVSGQTSSTTNNLSYIRNAGYTSITAHVNAKEATAAQKGVIAFFAEDSEDIVTDETAPISVVLSTLPAQGFSDFTADVPGGTKTIVVYTAVKENVSLSTITLSSPAVPDISERVTELEQREAPSINLASYNGYSLPRNPQTLRILSVGNSYVQVPMQRLTEWLSALGITNVVYAYTYHSGASLAQYYNSVNADTAFADFYVSTNGGAFTRIDASTGQETSTSYVSKLTDAFSYASWDVITFQQASSYAHQLDTITPYLPNLIEAARTYCPNAGVKIAWRSTHAHAVGYTDTPNVEQQNAVYSGIVEVAKYLESNYGLDLIIPSGTYVQNLRTVSNSYLGSLGNSAYEGGASYKMLTKGNDTYTGGSDWCDFTSDGSHLNRYASIGDCALFVQLLINSCFGKSIRHVDIEDWHYHQDATMLHLQSIVRQSAVKAINNRYEVSTIDTSSDIY